MSVNLPDPKVLPLTPRSSFCPHPTCPNRGQVGHGNIVIHSQRERRYKCTTCGKTFAATQGTVYYRKQHGHDLITLVLTLLAHGCPLQAIVIAFLLDERTVGQWARDAGAHCRQVHEHLVETGQVSTQHVQADELWVKLVGAKVWQAMALAVESRLWLGGVISAVRDQALITRLVARVRASVASLDVLVCVDGLRSYVVAVTRAFRVKVPRHGRRGRCRHVLAEGLQLGQVVKSHSGRRLTDVARRVVHGTAEGIRAVLQATGTGRDIHTAYIERLNATFRGRWAGLARKSRRLARTVGLAEAGMWLVGTVYNFCTPHASLDGQTPAVAAGLVPQRWTPGELFTYRVPLPAWVPPKSRGRPKGSKNRPKEVRGT